jgi:uncharacterized membrane protein YkvA (DUF1232 family)
MEISTGGRVMADDAGQFVGQGFWQKIQGFAAAAGREVVEKALILFFAAQRPETPLWAKTVIYSALAYLVLPTDAIPDFIPLSGYADDLGTLVAALGAVTMCITPEVKAAAKQTVEGWFGQRDSSERGTPQAHDPIRTIEID